MRYKRLCLMAALLLTLAALCGCGMNSEKRKELLDNYSALGRAYIEFGGLITEEKLAADPELANTVGQISGDISKWGDRIADHLSDIGSEEANELNAGMTQRKAQLEQLTADLKKK